MSFKAAFLFIAPETDPKIHRTVLETPAVTLHVVGVKTYREAAAAALSLVEEGVTALELCAGFGNEGTALVAKAVGDRALVGVVRFDLHPGFGHRSGDAVFAQ